MRRMELVVPQLNSGPPKFYSLSVDQLMKRVPSFTPDQLFELLTNTETGTHSLRVEKMMGRFAMVMGFPDATVTALREGGRLHDIGKVMIPTTTMYRPDKLTPGERQLTHFHPLIGAKMLWNYFPVDSPQPWMALCHHIWVDANGQAHNNGGGYPHVPDGLRIPLPACILAVIDVFEAATSKTRCYRDPLPPNQILQEIYSLRGIQFDPRVVDAFIKYFDSITAGLM